MQVVFALWYEWFFGRQATSHLCVSKAMQLFLQAEWGITATVFYDTPPTWFHKANLHEQHELCTRIAADLNAPMHDDDPAYHVRSPYSQHHFDTVQDKPKHAEANGLLRTDFNVFTQLVEGKPQLKPLRPALLVSSTSWTMDEDFGILLQAALQYDQMVGMPTVTQQNFFIACTSGPSHAHKASAADAPAAFHGIIHQMFLYVPCCCLLHDVTLAGACGESSLSVPCTIIIDIINRWSHS